MKTAISQIDRALKRLNDLPSALQAEDFLMPLPPSVPVSTELPGALYIQPPTSVDESLGLGIYLHAQIEKTLTDFPSWQGPWSTQQLCAFSVAAEEVSHFHYVAHHAPQGRAVSQLELEIQGEVDKFLLAYFASNPLAQLLESFFVGFRWVKNLSAVEHARYAEASRVAKAFLVKHSDLLARPDAREELLRVIRRFYRLSLEEKFTLATP